MSKVSRRDLLKTGLLAPAAVAVVNGIGPMGIAMQAAGEDSQHPLPESDARRAPSGPGAGRERLLLDFGWRFHFGNADDPAKDFDFGSGRTGNFQKSPAVHDQPPCFLLSQGAYRHTERRTRPHRRCNAAMLAGQLHEVRRSLLGEGGEGLARFGRARPAWPRARGEQGWRSARPTIASVPAGRPSQPGLRGSA